MKWLLVLLSLSAALLAVLFSSCGDDDDKGGGGGDGLTWQNPPSADFMNWQAAREYCEGLENSGLSDWRMPNIDELRTLIRGCPATEAGGECDVSEDCLYTNCWVLEDCDGCDLMEGPGTDGCYWDTVFKGECGWYWSSLLNKDDDGIAWNVHFDSGSVESFQKESDLFHIRCVRP